MAAEDAAARAEEEAETFLGPMPPDVIAEAEQAGADKPTAEVLRICRCSHVVLFSGLLRFTCHARHQTTPVMSDLVLSAGGC